MGWVRRLRHWLWGPDPAAPRAEADLTPPQERGRIARITAQERALATRLRLEADVIQAERQGRDARA